MAINQTYTVKLNDSLASIAQKFYGDGNLWRLIYDANRNTIGHNPDLIKAGMVLVIPAKDNPHPPGGGTRLSLGLTH